MQIRRSKKDLVVGVTELRQISEVELESFESIDKSHEPQSEGSLEK